MNIADNLELLKTNKDAIRNAITRKGVLTGGNMSTYADNIMQIGRGVFPDIPDLLPIAIQDDVIYFTVAPKAYWGMSLGLDKGTYTVESGTIVGGVYVSNSIDSSSAYINNTNYYCVNNTDAYIVYRLTCTSHINMLKVKSDTTKGTLGIIEVYGAMPYVASMSFSNCATLRTCTIKSRLQLITNMQNCFQGCSSLTTLDSSSWVLSAVTSMIYCFQGCSSLTTLDSSSWVLSAVTSMIYCFQGCSSLTTLDSSSWVLSAVTNMQNCFQSCSSLTTLDSSSWVLSAVTSMASCFQGCSSLTTLDSSSWVLSAVTNMFYCFSGCSSLTTLDSSSWVLSAVTSMQNCFQGCSSLTTLDSSSWVLSAVTSMQNCFQGCSSLTTLDSSSWVLSAVTNMFYCFQGCSSLTIIINMNFQNITDMSNFSCPKLVHFRFLNYGARGDYKTAITLGSQVDKADIIQFFADMFGRSTAGYSVLTVTITQPSSKFTASEIAVATNKGYTITFNG